MFVLFVLSKGKERHFAVYVVLRLKDSSPVLYITRKAQNPFVLDLRMLLNMA